MACSVLTDKQTNRQTNRQTNKKAKTEAALSGLSEFLASAHHQGAVQNMRRINKTNNDNKTKTKTRGSYNDYVNGRKNG